MKKRNPILAACMSGILKDEKGSALILMTIALAAMLTMAALVVDVGIAYCHGSRLQNAADAAVFAGGRLLPAEEWDTDRLCAIEDRDRSIWKERRRSRRLSPSTLRISSTDPIMASGVP